MTRADKLLGGTVLLGLAAVGAAMVSQYGYNIQPCPWCVLQRLIFVCIAAAALVALLWRSPIGQRIGSALALLLAGCGIAAALWQHFVAAASASCDLSLAERIISTLGLDETLPQVFMPLASCADAAVKMLGVPYEFYSLALFVVIETAMLVTISASRR